MNHNRSFTKNYFLNYQVLAFIFLGLVCLGGGVSADNVKIIKNPVPTCEEFDYCKLIKVAEMEEQDEAFLIHPSSMVVDNWQNIYVFDRKHIKIFKYDKNLNFLKSYGNKGRGPGDFGTVGLSEVYLTIGKDNVLYAGDRYNRRIHCFSLELKLLKTIKLEGRRKAHIVPVLDKKQNLYIYSSYESNNVLEVYNQKGKIVNSLLDKKELKTGLFHIFPKISDYNYTMSHPKNIRYDFLGDRLYVFSFISGYLYQFENMKAKSKSALWPKKALEHYQTQLEKALKKEMYLYYFQNFFVDKDTHEDIYLSMGKELGMERWLLYRFDKNGKLKNVLFIDTTLHNSIIKLHYKKNDLFYGLTYTTSGDINLITFKEESIN